MSQEELGVSSERCERLGVRVINSLRAAEPHHDVEAVLALITVIRKIQALNPALTFEALNGMWRRSGHLATQKVPRKSEMPS